MPAAPQHAEIYTQALSKLAAGDWPRGLRFGTLLITDPSLGGTIMALELHFTDDELAQLHLLSAQDTEKTRVELHHTSGMPYRESLKRRLAQRNALLDKMNAALPTLVVADSNA